MEEKIILQELEQSLQNLPNDFYESLKEAVQKAPRIFVYGTGRSGFMLKAFAMRLMQIGFTSYVVGETITPSIQKDDLLFLASSSGETPSVVDAAKSAKNAGAKIITITGQKDSSLSVIEEPILRIESGSKFETSKASVQPLGSLFEQALLILLDAFVLHLSSGDKDLNDEMAKQHANLE
ncbi:MAG: 6-phospho-3-hexuloisomerase [Peptoniphilaceae bacterium]|nr:6-phospho-3-hexuloisomerase [Peptoniphilaceae bacterium]MDD7434489.1 6-phospho-3-hexuloisomerase [Peptoniphilaceae bacterium]MDY3076476.1 6-phospho-3-hexuloisomerase [Peptoniphilaceae bacterium]